MKIELCANCGNEYTPKRKGNKYCSATCRVYASQERTGVRITEYKPPEIIGVPEYNAKEGLEEIETLKNSLAEVKKNISTIKNRSIIYDMKNQLQIIDNEPVMNLEERKERNERAIKLQSDLDFIVTEFDEMQEHLPNLYIEMNVLITKLFRATESYNEFMIQDIDRKGVLSGEQLDRLEKFRIHYPFEQYEKSKNELYFNSFLHELPKPFSCYLTERENYITVEYYHAIIKDMLATLNPKILFVGYAFTRYDKIKDSATSENFYFKSCHHKNDILASITLIDPEIVFIEGYEEMKLDIHFIRKMKELFYNTSFFVNTNEIQDDLIPCFDYHLPLYTGNGEGTYCLTISEDANYQLNLLETFREFTKPKNL